MDLKELDLAPAQRHPWEVARAEFFRDVLQRRGLLDSPGTLTVLDVGAGDGYVAQRILEVAPTARVVCFDPNYTDEHLRSLEAGFAFEGLQFTRLAPNGLFRLMLCLDVLEHVPDDGGVLKRMVESHLALDGTLLLSVPAWPTLYTRHDLGLGHYRRYTPAQLHRLIDGCGLHPVTGGGLFHALVPFRALGKLVEIGRFGRTRPGDHGFGYLAPGAGTTGWRHGSLVTKVVGAGLRADNWISGWWAGSRVGWKAPGLSLWALCERQR